VKISIVTISFNQAPFLELAIRSIVEQGYKDLEYIVVDPGSTDGSREIIEKYRSKITKVIFEKDSGPADGLNNGFSCATGEIFGFINADDALLPGSLWNVSNYFEKNLEVDVVCGSGSIIDAEDRVMKRVQPTRFSKRLYVYGAVTFLQQSTFFRKKAFLETDGFNKDNRTCWDGELFLDMAVHHQKFGILHKDLALFRIYNTSISGSGNLSDIYKKDCNRIFKKVTGRGENFFDKLLAKVYRLEKLVMYPRVTLTKLFTRMRHYK